MKDFLENDIFIGSHVVTSGGGVNKKAVVTRLHEQCVSLRLYDGSTGVAYPENLIVIEAPTMDIFNQELKVGDRVAYRGTKDQAALSLGVIKSISGRVIMVLGDGRSRCAPCNPLNTVKAP